MSIDLLLTNANVLTMDPARPYAGAVGVRDGRIVWVGDADEARTHLSGVEKTVDLGGATLIPAFNDAHNHLMLLGHWLSQVDCSYPTVKTIDDILAAVGDAAERTR